MSQLLYKDIIVEIAKILARNGETRSLSLLRIAKKFDSKIGEPLVFNHRISEKYRTFRLPLTINPSEKIKIDWGDGTVENIEHGGDADDIFLLHVIVKHEYPKSTSCSWKKKYRVIIYGDKYSVRHIGYCPDWADGITNFITLGNLGIIDLSGLFYCCRYFNGILSENFNTSRVKDMRGMFYNAANFNQPFNANWDTGNVTDMSHMFNSADSFNQPFPANWDTANVRDMRCMFYNAESFNQPLSGGKSGGKSRGKWDTGNVRDMGLMFSYAKSFNQPLNFNTVNVTDMSFMFRYAISFNQPLNFNTVNVTNMYGMFYYAKSFNQLLNFDMSNVEDRGYMFHNATSFNRSFPLRNIGN